MNISLLVIILLFGICIFLVLKIYFMKKSIKEIESSFKFILNSDTNNIISISSEDKSIKQLAICLNKELKNLRNKRLKYENGNQELERLITDISHDLRTPLTAINGYTELLGEGRLTEKEKEYIKIIDNKINELTLLTEQLRDLSIGLDIENLKKEKCSINDILAETIASYYNFFKNRNMVPTINICEKKIYKNVDKNMLIRVFENLISNIIKYSDNGNCEIILQENRKNLFYK